MSTTHSRRSPAANRRTFSRNSFQRRSIASGDRVLFLSDGIPEAPRPNGEPLGYEETARLIAATGDAPHGEAWLEALLGNVRARVEERLADDWTAVVIHITSS